MSDELVAITVKPRSTRAGVELGPDGGLVVRVHAPAAEGAANREVLATLPQAPTADSTAALATRLKHASESADSTLLKRRNEKIIADLENARQRARVEMEELETLLEMKKNELNKSILAAQTDRPSSHQTLASGRRYRRQAKAAATMTPRAA